MSSQKLSSRRRKSVYVSATIAFVALASLIFYSAKFSSSMFENLKTPISVENFFEEFRNVTKNTRFEWGLSDPTLGGLDSAGAVVAALKASLLVPSSYTYHGDMDLDVGADGEHSFTTCRSPLLPGDILALGSQCPTPESWAVVKTITPHVGELEAKNWVQSVAEVMDFGSDGKGFTVGEPRAFLREKSLCACLRPWKFQKDWGSLARHDPRPQNLERPTEQAALINDNCLFKTQESCPVPKNGMGHIRIFNLWRFEGKNVQVIATVPTEDSVNRPIASVGKVGNGVFEFRTPLKTPGRISLELFIDDAIVRTFHYEISP